MDTVVKAKKEPAEIIPKEWPYDKSIIYIVSTIKVVDVKYQACSFSRKDPQDWGVAIAKDYVEHSILFSGIQPGLETSVQSLISRS